MQWNLFACFMSARSMHGSSRHCLNCGNGSAKRDCRAGSRAGPSRPSVYADERNHARESFRCPWGCPGQDFQWVRLQECPASDRACVMLLFICPRFWTAMSVTPRFWTAMLLYPKILNRNACYSKILNPRQEPRKRMPQWFRLGFEAFGLGLALHANSQWLPVCDPSQDSRPERARRKGLVDGVRFESFDAVSQLLEKRESSLNECSAFTPYATQNPFISQVC